MWAAAGSSDSLRLAELVEAMDDWLTGGGFLPRAWTAPHDAADGRAQQANR